MLRLRGASVDSFPGLFPGFESATHPRAIAYTLLESEPLLWTAGAALAAAVPLVRPGDYLSARQLPNSQRIIITSPLVHCML